MPSRLPAGAPVPPAGPHPETGPGEPFGLYVHVPFCSVRCGYCDFNTYTAAEAPGVRPADYPAAVLREADLLLASRPTPPPPVRTVFLGGGTPTLLAPPALQGLLRGLREVLPWAADAEVTCEANPDTVTAAMADALVAAGVTRVSLGMQSAVPEVLGTLDRTHQPEAVAAAVQRLRAAGIAQLSVDLIYGTPGETDQQWRRSLDAALELAPDHVSAYALVAEPGTALARRIRRGELPAVDDDVLALRYATADEVLTGAGLPWYEVSNWGAPCRHNVGYWSGADWWGLGPGAHSHVAGRRWWNVKHPTAYQARLDAGVHPADALEDLDPAAQHLERVMLGVRMSAGLPLGALRRADAGNADPGAAAALRGLVDDGLVEVQDGRLRLTQRGRLLADLVVRTLTD